MSMSRRIMMIVLVAILAVGALFTLSSPGADSQAVGGAVDPAGLSFRTMRLVATEDTTLHSWFPFTNYGESTNLALRSGDISTALLKFDLSPLPGDALVAQATLRLYVLSYQDQHNLTIAAYSVNRPWSEREATWNLATKTTSWSVPGCNGVPADRAGTGSDPVEISGGDKWVVLDVTDLVQAWIEGTASNNGFVIKTMPGVSVERRLASSEYPNTALRPVLQVVYGILPTPTPTGTPPPVAPEPRLRVTKAGPEGPLYDPNLTIRYDITVQNVGTDIATGVVITDELPLGVEYISSSLGGAYNPDDRIITWQIESLGIDETLRLEVYVKLADWIKAGGIVVNLAYATCPKCPVDQEVGLWSILVGPPSPTPTYTPSPTEEIAPTLTPTPTEVVTPTSTPQPTRYIQYLVNVRKNFRDVP